MADPRHLDDRPPVAAEAVAEPPGTEVVLPAEERVAELEAEVERLKDERLRALADAENTRRRAQRDRQEASQYAISGLARDLLSVSDNLQRALASIDPAGRAVDPALDTLASGIEMTQRELLAVLERYGVKPIEAEGKPFDPHVHEAMFEINDPSVAHGTVLQVLERGYLLHDRTLRPARVAIARGGPKRPAADAAAGEASEPAAVERNPDPYRAGPREDTPGRRVDETL
ncbi:MAG: nucleotide exchange factor GrpE [Rhodospirillales bacterium]